MIEDTLPTFNDVRNPRLQAYNRLMTFLNVVQDAGQGLARDYLKGLPHNGRAVMIKLKKEIETDGFSRISQDIIKNHRVEQVGVGAV